MAKYKTLTFACVHILVAFTVVGWMTGSWALGGLVALIEPAINTVAYFFHERVWEHCSSRRMDRRSPRPADRGPDDSREEIGPTDDWLHA